MDRHLGRRVIVADCNLDACELGRSTFAGAAVEAYARLVEQTGSVARQCGRPPSSAVGASQIDLSPGLTFPHDRDASASDHRT